MSDDGIINFWRWLLFCARSLTVLLILSSFLRSKPTSIFFLSTRRRSFFPKILSRWSNTADVFIWKWPSSYQEGTNQRFILSIPHATQAGLIHRLFRLKIGRLTFSRPWQWAAKAAQDKDQASHDQDIQDRICFKGVEWISRISLYWLVLDKKIIMTWKPIKWLPSLVSSLAKTSQT